MKILTPTSIYKESEPVYSFTVELGYENRIFYHVAKYVHGEDDDLAEMDVCIDLNTFKATCDPLKIEFITHTSIMPYALSSEERLEIERICSEFARENYDDIMAGAGNNLQFEAQ
jgi:hypothetical protein